MFSGLELTHKEKSSETQLQSHPVSSLVVSILVVPVHIVLILVLCAGTLMLFFESCGRTSMLVFVPYGQTVMLVLVPCGRSLMLVLVMAGLGSILPIISKQLKGPKPPSSNISFVSMSGMKAVEHLLTKGLRFPLLVHSAKHPAEGAGHKAKVILYIRLELTGPESIDEF